MNLNNREDEKKKKIKKALQEIYFYPSPRLKNDNRISISLKQSFFFQEINLFTFNFNVRILGCCQ